MALPKRFILDPKDVTIHKAPEKKDNSKTQPETKTK